ncbi:MAG: hypothetical protein J4G19_00615 [Pseudomonadales bacterium]|nr:hypothetical protein [Pseudomonadales bacterium]
MNEQDFEKLLDLYGSDVARWPEHEREEASALLSQSRSASELLNAQATVEKRLADAMLVPETYGLEQKIMARFATHKQRFDIRYWMEFIWKPAFAAACSLAFGFYLGAANQEVPTDLEEDLAYVTFYDYESWSGDSEDES